YDNTADKHTELRKNYHVSNDTSFTNYKRRAFHYDWWAPVLLPAYNPDDGVLIGLGFTYKKQIWNKAPFGWQQTIGGNYAASTGSYSLYYIGVFKQIIGKWDIDLSTRYDAPTYIINFYGYGNETSIGDHSKSFFRSRASSFTIKLGVARTWKYNSFTS